MLGGKEGIRLLSLAFWLFYKCWGTSQYRLFGLDVYFDVVSSRGSRGAMGRKVVSNKNECMND